MLTEPTYRFQFRFVKTSLLFRELGSSNVGGVFTHPPQSLLLVSKQSAPFVTFPDGEDSASLSQPSWAP